LPWAAEPAQGNVNPGEIAGFLCFGFISHQLAAAARGLALPLPVQWEEQRRAGARDREEQALRFG